MFPTSQSGRFVGKQKACPPECPLNFDFQEQMTLEEKEGISLGSIALKQTP